ncbi:hypothetical protein HDU97_000964 [Phlyctochytrium planicorne]|nr:hypothetical protein HDU97_000964 [Phlyctochytrium planicorne]
MDNANVPPSPDTSEASTQPTTIEQKPSIVAATTPPPSPSKPSHIIPTIQGDTKFPAQQALQLTYILGERYPLDDPTSPANILKLTIDWHESLGPRAPPIPFPDEDIIWRLAFRIKRSKLPTIVPAPEKMVTEHPSDSKKGRRDREVIEVMRIWYGRHDVCMAHLVAFRTDFPTVYNLLLAWSRVLAGQSARRGEGGYFDLSKEKEIWDLKDQRRRNLHGLEPKTNEGTSWSRLYRRLVEPLFREEVRLDPEAHVDST